MRRIAPLLAASALVLVAGAARAQTTAPARATRAATASPVPDIPYTKYTLKNGLTLLVHEDHKAPIAAVNVWYHVGSKNEKPGKTGFAHLFEHLMFNGSENYNDDYFKAVEPIGATDLNGTTNEDRTNYFQNVPISALDRILWLESDRMGHLLGAIDTAKLNEQRGVVQNEKRQGENEPYGKSWITVAENTFPKGHPYSWSVIGSMDDLNAASLEDVKDWFRTYYGPANATLVVAGDVSADDIRQRVERYFGDIPSGPPIVKHEAWIAKMEGEHRQIMQDHVPQARLIKVYNVPPYGTQDIAYLGLALDILAGGKSSRLYNRLVYKDRSASSVQSFVDDREIASQLWFLADAQPGGDLKTVEKAFDEELARFIATGPSAAELQRAQTRARADFIRGIERIGGFGGKSDVLARGQVFRGDPETYKRTQAWIAGATPADIQNAMRKWVAGGSYVLEVQPFPEYETVASTVDRKKLPDVGAPPAAPLAAPERATLSNGMKVMLSRRSAIPAVRLRMVLDGGYAADPAAKPGLASLAMQMLDEGTTSRTAPQIADQLASLGVNLNAGADLDAMFVSINALKDKLDPALAIYSDVVLHPSFPQSDLDRVKKIQLANIQQEKVQPFTMGLRVLPQLLYGPGHAYGQPLTGSGTEASVNAITRGDLAAFHSTWFKPNHATIVAVGDITMPELTAKLERAFAGWKAGDVPAKNVAAVQNRSRKTVYLLDRPGADQSYVFAGSLVTPRADPDYIPFDIFNNAFGGAFVSRINMNLRENKHWSYGSFSFPIDARGQRMWMVMAPVQTDKTKESLQEAIKEVTGAVGDRPLTAAEIADAKDRSIKTLAGRWETGAAVAGALGDIVEYGLPDDYYATYADQVKNASDAQINAVGKKLVDPNDLVWVVVGDREKIEPGIRALGIGQIVLLDADGRPKSPTP
ncbi:MAG: insulinase family protein [Gemmatimonadaceae bacterium]|nr:insulinase family protein [Gemmatimonadaceae bacterium]NUQ94773.1 insulinase family protein [Gemmatimonadaceae bacterium]